MYLSNLPLNPAFFLLQKLDKTNPIPRYFARYAAGLAPVANHKQVTAWLACAKCKPNPSFDFDLNRTGRCVLTLSTGSPGMEYANDPKAYRGWIERRFEAENARFAIGIYGECRNVYKGDHLRLQRQKNAGHNISGSISLSPLTPHCAHL